ncbi:MAG: hypothetical protein ABFS45_19355 [Pseudomonadota bacterium]
MVKLRLPIWIFCLLLSQLVAADSNSGRHWSEGVYFPPQTQPDRAPRPSYTPPSYTPPSYTPPSYTPPSYTPPSYTPPSYTPPEQPAYAPAGKKRYNPWALPAEGNGAQRAPSYESLGYPGEGYDPYRSADQLRQPPPGQVDRYAPRYGDYPAADYYPDKYRYDKEISPSDPQYPPTEYERGYPSRPHSPAYGVDEYYPPLYDFGTQGGGGGLNPFFLYGAGLPYLPSWW